jgi:hypothetical protein
MNVKPGDGQNKEYMNVHLEPILLARIYKELMVKLKQQQHQAQHQAQHYNQATKLDAA